MKKIVWKMRVWYGKTIKLLLRAAFGFDRWHIFTLDEKQYARDIIVWCNRRPVRNSFAEIGCGMGDIVRHVRYSERVGYDLDERILKAARFLVRITGKKQLRFSLFSFPDSPLPGSHDVILMVNWIHHIEPAMLKARIEEYFAGSLNHGGTIIIDTVQDPEYKFNHDIRYLTRDLPATVGKLGDYERRRQIWLINKQ
ncbi:MAG TPA: class I SAM-dependent methyltransferase [Puia sp.]|jgi:SAM-dependent methyltransferase|nr:class I SAM-dependent methyltransferase [Puia sp.]